MFNARKSRVDMSHAIFLIFLIEHQVDGKVWEEFDEGMCATSSMHTHILVYATQSHVDTDVWSTFVLSFQSY